MDEVLKTKNAPERYRVEVRHRRGWAYEVQLVTTHMLHTVGEHGEPLEFPALITTSLEQPPLVLGERWARWKARRMVAAAYRRDVREGQPWAVQR